MKQKENVKSRFLYLHPEVNPGKVQALDALQEQYTAYLKVCVDCMIGGRRFGIPQSERQAFFPRCSELSSQIVKNARAHAVAIVSGWASSKYRTTLRSYTKLLARVALIDAPMRQQLCTIGKRGVDTPGRGVTQQGLDLYWRLLRDEKVSGRQPTISRRCGMMMSEMTSVLATSEQTRLTRWWIAFSHLEAGKRIALPLVGSPYVKLVEEVSKGVLASKTKQGRWRFEAVERDKCETPRVAPSMPRVGVDVGLNVVAATSEGLLLGRELKPKFDRARKAVLSTRANRQRQGLEEDSPRLACLEAKLTGLIRSITGKVANDLVRAYPGAAFVLEDLNLRGAPGQKRMAYRALHRSLKAKAPCLEVCAAYTSQTCPSCGWVARANRRATVFACKYCGRKSHAPAPPGRRLTTRVPRGTGTAANRAPISTA